MVEHKFHVGDIVTVIPNLNDAPEYTKRSIVSEMRRFQGRPVKITNELIRRSSVDNNRYPAYFIEGSSCFFYEDLFVEPSLPDIDISEFNSLLEVSK